jgi:hypothetical protein
MLVNEFCSEVEDLILLNSKCVSVLYRTSDSASSKLMDGIVNVEENSVGIIDTNPWQR